MHYQLNLLSAAAAVGLASAATIPAPGCPNGGHGPIEFWLDVVDMDGKSKGINLDYLPISPAYSLLNTHTRDDAPSWINGFHLDKDGSVSILYRDTDGSARPNSGFDWGMVAVSGNPNVPKITKNGKQISGWKPVVAVDGVQAHKFGVVTAPQGDFLVPNDLELGWRGWALCKTESTRDGYPVLVWADNGNPDYAGVCENVQLKVEDCTAA